MPIRECKRCAVEFDALNARRLYCFLCRNTRSPPRIAAQEREGKLWREMQAREIKNGRD